jgi:membrane protein DedA with SNARE-associated domain
MLQEMILLAASTLVSEDLACIVAGTLVAQGKLDPWGAVVACGAGIFAGDLLLYWAGRLAGARVGASPAVQRAARWIQERGLLVVLLSRFTPGLRLPTYLAAGLVRAPALRFAAYLLVAAALWTPWLVWGSAWLGEALIRELILRQIPRFAALAATAGALYAAVAGLRRLMGARRAWARWRRWEFWPPWAAYLPLIPHWVWLAVRYRSATVFTAANPGIFSGGVVGESKAQTLRHLPAAAPWVLIPQGQDSTALREFVDEFPVVMKPDQGERGHGVSIVRSWEEVERYLNKAPGDTIVQRYVAGCEFGVFYYRMPGEQKGHVFSVTEKRFPALTGDGRRTVWELILADRRAAAIAETYRRVSRLPMDSVPAAGERVTLVEIGSHCRGAVFLNGRQWNTPALAAAMDELARGVPGFYFGRFDVRVPSAEALAAGEGITVLELNGVTSEATHIYDPAVSLSEAYETLREQWTLAFAIGARNRAAGYEPMPVAELIRLALMGRRDRRGRRGVNERPCLSGGGC